MSLKYFGWMAIVVFAGFGWGHEGQHAPLDGASTKIIKQKIATFEQRLEKNATDMNALAQLGTLYEQLGRATGAHDDFAKASRFFEKLLAIDPANAQALHGLCLTSLARHQFKQGLDYARLLGEVAPRDQETYLLLGDAHFFLGNYTEAAVFFERAYQERQHLPTMARIAQLHEARGDYGKAVEHMTQALATVANDPEKRTQKAWVLTMLAEMDLQTNEMARAEKRFREALAADPNTHYAYWRLAAIHQHKGQLQEARHIMHDLVHQQPRMAYQMTYAKIWQDLKRPERARYWYGKAEAKALAELKAGDYGHVRDLVALYAATGKHLDKALSYALKEFQEIRQDAEGAEWVGWLYYLNGQAEKGMPYIRKAMRLGTATPRFQLRAALVSHAAGDTLLAAQLIHLANSESTLVDPELAKRANELRDWIKKNPDAIRAQFKKRATSK